MFDKIEKEKEMFEVTNNIMDANYTCLQSNIKAPPKLLCELLGEPLSGDGHKVTMEWILSDKDGNIATVYDWKATSDYGTALPSAQELRESSNPHDFHIGAHDHDTASVLKSWLSDIISNHKK
tara:strand:+ start:484 stop:852 length:369 start_codon:yes stop_codon:yes gene_type:complete